MRPAVIFTIVVFFGLASGCEPAGGEFHDRVGDAPPVQWDPIECTSLPGTPLELERTPRENPDIELLALQLSTSVVAEQPVYERLAADIATIGMLEPRVADIGYSPKYDGKSLLLEAGRTTLEAMANGSYSAWNCLNEYYGADGFEDRQRYGLLRLEGIYDLEQLAALYAELPEIAGAAANYRVGAHNGSTIYVTREEGEWYYVIDAASGDCASGCIEHVLHLFVSEPGGAVRYMDRSTVPPYDPQPGWVETYWRNAESREAWSVCYQPSSYTDFDREGARTKAEALVGLEEDDLKPGPGLRIVRRGDEWLPVTMDLRPGRMNVELDDNGSGTFAVTRITVEVPCGEELIIE